MEMPKSERRSCVELTEKTHSGGTEARRYTEVA